MKKITSKDNRWIKLAIQLKQKKYRDKNDMFLMEGMRSAEDAQNQQIKDVICFIQDNKIDGASILSIVEEGKKLHWFFLSIDEGLFSFIQRLSLLVIFFMTFLKLKIQSDYSLS